MRVHEIDIMSLDTYFKTYITIILYLGSTLLGKVCWSRLDVSLPE